MQKSVIIKGGKSGFDDSLNPKTAMYIIDVSFSSKLSSYKLYLFLEIMMEKNREFFQATVQLIKENLQLLREFCYASLISK